jgi:hypothetical protein
MRKNWVNDVLDDAVRAVRSWPSWMLRTEVRSPEGAPQSNGSQVRDSGDEQQVNETEDAAVLAK